MKMMSSMITLHMSPLKSVSTSKSTDGDRIMQKTLIFPPNPLHVTKVEYERIKRIGY